MGLPVNTKIEKKALNVLEEIIDDCPTMDYNFNSVDKEMCWDGYIWIFKNSGIESKKNYDDKIPVQIKGHNDSAEKYINESKITYSVSKDDLNVYFNDRGVLYFQIFISSDGKRKEIFYASLFNAKIKKYLEEIEQRGNKGSIKVPFIKLDKKDIYIIVKQFSNESWKQGSGTKGQLIPNIIMLNDMDKVTSMTAKAVGAKNEYEFLQKLSTGDVCFYGTTKDNTFQIPLEWVDDRIFFINKEIEQIVSIRNEIFYERYELSMSSNKDISIILSANTHIQLSKGKFHFKPKSGIKQLRKDAEFLLKVVEEKEIMIGDMHYPFGNLNMPKNLEDKLKFYIELEDTLDMIEFEYDEPFEKIELQTCHQLQDLVAWKKGLRNQQLVEKAHILNWKIEDKYMPIIIHRHNYDEKNDMMKALYTNKHQSYVKNNNEYFKVPVFAHIQKHVLGNLYYYNYSYFYNQVDEADYNMYTIDRLNQAALNLISAYDINGDTELLNIAMHLLQKISVVEAKDYIKVNIFQIKKRRGELLPEDIESLKNMRSEDLQMEYGISVLLGDRDKAKRCYEQIDEETRATLTEYPIFTLYQDLISKGDT